MEGKSKFFRHVEHRDGLQKYPQRSEHMVNVQHELIETLLAEDQ